MSVELQNVKRRIASTQQIRKVTSAMQRVASARLVNDRKAMEHSNRYTHRLVEIIHEVGDLLPGVDHPLVKPHRTVSRVAVVAFSSERGLCGGFNSGLIETLLAFRNTRPSQDIELTVVGRVMARKMTRRGLPPAHFHHQPSRTNRAAVLDTITANVTGNFTSGQVDEVYILYASFVTSITQLPVVERIIPVPIPEDGATGRFAAAIFEPGPEVLMARLLPEFVRQSMDHAFLNSLASENAARQSAMSRATDNAGDILKELQLSYSRLRQESITAEMLELVGGGMGRV